MFYTTGDPGTDVMVCFVRMPVLISAAWFVPIAVLNADSGTDVGSGLYQEGRLPLHLVCASQKLSRCTPHQYHATMPPYSQYRTTTSAQYHQTLSPEAQQILRPICAICMDEVYGPRSRRVPMPLMPICTVLIVRTGHRGIVA
eukprot:2664730-Rhodomonas_salina.2